MPCDVGCHAVKGFGCIMHRFRDVSYGSILPRHVKQGFYLLLLVLLSCLLGCVVQDARIGESLFGSTGQLQSFA